MPSAHTARPSEERCKQSGMRVRGIDPSASTKLDPKSIQGTGSSVASGKGRARDDYRVRHWFTNRLDHLDPPVAGRARIRGSVTKAVRADVQHDRFGLEPCERRFLQSMAHILRAVTADAKIQRSLRRELRLPYRCAFALPSMRHRVSREPECDGLTLLRELHAECLSLQYSRIGSRYWSDRRVRPGRCTLRWNRC